VSVHKTPAPRRSRSLEVFLVTLVLALAAFLRLETLGRRPLWFDERWTQQIVVGSSGAFDVWRVGRLDHAQHPPLSYLAAYLADPSGASAARLRLPAAIAGIASIALLIALGTSLFGFSAGLLAGFLMAISVYHVDSSQDARPYMLSVAFTIGQYGSLFAFLRTRRTPWLAALVLCTIAALYTYHLALLHAAIGLALGAASLAADRAGGADGHRPPWQWLAGAYGLVALAYLPQVPNLQRFVADSRHPTPNHVLDPSLRFLHELVSRWGSDGAAPLYEGLFVLGAASVLARRRLLEWGVLAWCVAPLALFSLVPFAKYFDMRFLISGLPAFFALVAVGGEALARGSARGVAALLRSPGSAAYVRGAVLASLAAVFAYAAAGVYGAFRSTETRCGEFVIRPEVLAADDGFCARHLVLNTANPDQQFIVRSTQAAERAIDPDALAAFVGVYEFPGGGAIWITREGDRLMAQVPGRPKYELAAISADEFVYRTAGSRILFVRGAHGEVAALRFASTSSDVSARKVR
jgi:hypothetical protein